MEDSNIGPLEFDHLLAPNGAAEEWHLWQRDLGQHSPVPLNGQS